MLHGREEQLVNVVAQILDLAPVLIILLHAARAGVNKLSIVAHRRLILALDSALVNGCADYKILRPILL